MTEQAPTPITRREHLAAIALAFVCSVLFLREALIPGRALVPFAPELHDVLLLEAEARNTFDAQSTFQGHVGMGDKYFQSLCWDRVLHDRFAAGELPLWTRDIGGGSPLAAQFAQPYHPSNLLLLMLPAEQWYGWTLLLHQVLFGWFAYAFFRRMRCRHGAAMLAVVTSVLGLWLQSRVHHNVVISAALPTWLMLLLTHRLTDANARPRWRDAALLALTTGCSWLSGFPIVSLQATYLCVLMAGIRIVFLPKGTRRQMTVMFSVAMLLAALISMANMAPILFAYADSARRAVFDEGRLTAAGIEYAHLLGLLWPDLLGHAADHIYQAPEGAAASEWFLRQPWSQLVLLQQPINAFDGSSHQVWVETSFAAGSCATLCGLLAWCRSDHRRIATFFAGAGIIAFVAACAWQPVVSASGFVPGMHAGDLRRCLFVVSLAVTALSAFGANTLLESGRRLPLTLVALPVAAASTLVLVWLAQHSDSAQFVDALAAFYSDDNAAALSAEVQRRAAPGEIDNNYCDLVATAVRTLIVALALFALGIAKTRHRITVVVLLCMFELLHLSPGPVQTTAADNLRRAPAVLQPVLDATPITGVRPRLMRLMPPVSRLDQGLPGNYPGYLGIEDGSFYSGLAPQRAGEFFTAFEPNQPGKADIAYRTAGVGAFHDPSSLDHGLCDLFGVRFVMSAVPLPPSPRRVDRTPANSGGWQLWERTTALPRATFCTSIDVHLNREQRLLALSKPDRDVANRVILESSDAPTLTAQSGQTADVTITEHTDERVTVRVNNPSAGYLRLADPYDPGWTATVDGDSSRIWIADHHLRAVYLEAGEHEVVFAYDALRVKWPMWLSLAGLALTLLVLAASWRKR